MRRFLRTISGLVRALLRLILMFLIAVFAVVLILEMRPSLLAPGTEEGSAPPADSRSEQPLSPEGDHAHAGEALPPEKRYCRGLLTSRAEKKAYEDILRGMEERRETVTLKTKLDTNEVLKLAGYVQRDHPEYFWLTGEFRVTGTTFPDGISTMELSCRYSMEPEQIGEAERQVQSAAEEILARIDPGADDYEKIKAVFDWLVDHIDYTFSAMEDQSLYSAMVEGRGVCAGYARSTQYLLNRLGIPCATVTGLANGSSHAWNLVYADGEPYYLDTTWGDPIFTHEQEGANNISYRYFCVTDEVLFRTHQPSDDLPLPECTATACNYYVRNGLVLEEYDYDRVLEIAARAVRDRSNIEFCFTSRSAMNKAERELIRDGKIMDIYEDLNAELGETLFSGREYYYNTDPEELRLVFYPRYP